MTFRLGSRDYIILPVRIAGSQDTRRFHLLLDTGASRTVVNPYVIDLVGGEVGLRPPVTITTASGIEVLKPAVLGELAVGTVARPGFEVLVHQLPREAKIDGLLGMDFLQGLHLSVRLKRGVLTLEEDLDA